MGGSDVCPESYGEKALQPEWNGDRIRDDYEIALLRAFMAQRKPVLGICRGAQVINVAHRRHALPGHRHAGAAARSTTATGRSTSENCHATSFVPGSGLARLYPGHDARQDQLDPPPGGEGRSAATSSSRPGRSPTASSRRSATRARRTCSPCSGTRSSTRRTIPRSSTTRRSSTTSSPPRRGTRPPRTPSEPGARMKIINPADRRRHRRRRRRQRRRRAPQVRAARAGQPRWAKVPIAQAPRGDRARSASGSSRCTRRSRAR